MKIWNDYSTGWQWRQALESNSLRLSKAKTEYTTLNFGENPAASKQQLLLEDTLVKRIDQFKYVGSMVSKDTNINEDVKNRIKIAWMKWRSLTGVLCDKKMPVKVKSKMYKIAVRPAMVYEWECWSISRKQEQRLGVAEMKMFKWAGGVTLKDKIKNEYIRGSFKATDISSKIRENKLCRYEHIMSREEDHMTRRVLNIEVLKQGPGRPQATWLSKVRDNMKNMDLTQSTTQDRNLWRIKTRSSDPK